LLKVGDVIETDFSTVRIDDTLGQLVEVVSESSRNVFPVVDSKGRFQGYVSLEDIRKDMFRASEYSTLHVFNFMRSADAYVYDDEPMDSVMRKFETTSAWNLPVVRRSDRAYIGFVSKSKIFSAYRDELKMFSQD
jgi:CIC family chloride channel protein